MESKPTGSGASLRQTTNNPRMEDPNLLLSDWEDLLTSHAHLHPPEAARMLGVPEAALPACRIGSGAVRLQPNLPALLKPIQDWGRVLCAFSNAAGVHMPLGNVSLSVEPDHIGLNGKHMQSQIDPAAIADAYLFVDREESHGNTKSIQFFGGNGETILKVFVFHKTKFAEAEKHLLTYESDNQKRTIAPSPIKQTPFDAHGVSCGTDPDVEQGTEEIHTAVSQLLQSAGSFEVELIADHARAIWKGHLSGARIDADMFHLHEPDIRSHLRFSALNQIAKSRSGAYTFCNGDRRLIRIRQEASK